MRNYLKKLSLGLIASFMFIVLWVPKANAALVDEYNVSDSDSTVIILSGSVDGVKKNEPIRVQVLKKDISEKDSQVDWDKENILEYFALVEQVPALDDNGSYEVSVGMGNLSSDYYIVRVNGKVSEKKFFYATEIDKLALTKQFKEELSKGRDNATAKYKEILKLGEKDCRESLNVMVLNLNKDEFFKADPDKLSNQIYTILEKNKESEWSSNSFVNYLNLAAYITCIDEGKAEVIKYSSEFGLDPKYEEIYIKDLNEDSKESFDIYFTGKGYLTEEKIAEEFKKAVINALYKQIDVWSDADGFISKVGEDAGVDISGYNSTELDGGEKSTIHTYMMDNKNLEIDLYIKGINDLITEMIKPESSEGNDNGSEDTGSTGSSGFGGGGGGGGGGISMTPPITPSIAETPKTEEPAVEEFSDIKGYEWAQNAIESLAEKEIITGDGNGKFRPGDNITREEILAIIMRAFDVEKSGNESKFKDAEKDAWYIGLLSAAEEKGFISGRPDGTFGIGEAVTREDTAVMAYNIAKALGKEFDITVKGEFKDNSDVADYAKDAVYALKNAGVINGYEDNTFAPKATCTRAEAAKIIFTLIS